jgi:hypothetical protein
MLEDIVHGAMRWHDLCYSEFVCSNNLELDKA